MKNIMAAGRCFWTGKSYHEKIKTDSKYNLDGTRNHNMVNEYLNTKAL